MEELTTVAQELITELDKQAISSADNVVRCRGAIEGIQLLYQRLQETQTNDTGTTENSKSVTTTQAAE